MSVHMIIVLATYLLFWQGYKLRRRVNGLGNIALVLSLMATLANSVTARLSAAIPHSLFAGQFISLVEHIFVAISVSGLYLVRLAVEGRTIRSRRVRATIGLALAMCLAFTVLILAAIWRGKLMSISAETFRDPVGFLYNAGAGLYYGLTLAVLACWMVRYARSIQHRHFKLGMRIAALGVFVLSALCLVRVAPVFSVFLGGPRTIAPHWLLGTVSASAFPIIFLGLSYPLLVSRLEAYRAWKREQEASRRTQIVWDLCKAAYPEIVLRARSTRERLKDAVWKPDQVRRRRTETFDALAKLLLSDSETEQVADQAEAAKALREAVRRYDEVHDVPVVRVVAPHVALDPDQEGIPERPTDDAETRMLLDLAELLRNPSGNEHHVSA